MSLSPHSQIQFYSTRTSEPKTTFIKKSYSTVSKGKKPNSTAQQEPGAEFRITLEGWRHPADDQEFDEFMDDSFVYRSPPPRITAPVRIIPSNSGVRSSMERAYSSLREEVREVKEVKLDPVPVEPEKVKTRNRELSLEPKPPVEEPRAISPKEARLRREESRMSRQAELKKENREEYRSIPQVEISFNKDERIEPKMSRQERRDEPRVLRSVEKSSKHLQNKDDSNSPDRTERATADGPASGSAGKTKDKRAWIVKAIGQEPPLEPKLQIQNLVIQKLDKTTSSVATKPQEKPQWPARGAIRLDKLIKNEGAGGGKSDKHYALLALNPPKAATIQVNFEKKPSASQLAIFEKFQILHKEAQEREKEKEKYYLEHTSATFIPASKQKVSITKLEPAFEAPKATIKYVHKIKTSSLHSAQNLSNSAVDLESPSTTPSSKHVARVPKRRNVASMSLDKAHFESAGALDQLVQAILQENPPAGASWLNKTRVAGRRDVACFNDYANRTGDIDMKKTTLTPLSSYKIIAESRTKAVSPISLAKEHSKPQNQSNGSNGNAYPPKLQSQIEHIWSSIKHSSSVHSSTKRQTDRFGSDKLGELNQVMTMTRSVVGEKSSSLLDPKIDINEWVTIFAPPGRRTGRGRRSGEDLFQRDTPSNLLGKKDLSCPKISHNEQKDSL